MSVSIREAWSALHGLLFGAAFLLVFAGGLAGLYSLRPEWVTPAGAHARLRRLKIGLWAVAAIAWATVISGTYVVYPWYRAQPAEGANDLAAYPRYLLIADAKTARWHTLGMEWKEHVGWISPIAATVVAFAVSYYGPTLVSRPRVRRALLIVFSISLITAGIAGVFGAFISKVAPLR